MSGDLRLTTLCVRTSDRVVAYGELAPSLGPLVTAPRLDTPETMSSVASVWGIAVEAPFALHRLELTARVLVEQFGPDALPELHVALADAIGTRTRALAPVDRRRCAYAGMVAMVGWFHPARIEQLVHREWIAAPTNEFAEQVRVLDRIAAFADARTVEIVGAGVCRLGAHLAMRESVERVRCGDVSLIALAVGRCLVEGRIDDLPASCRRPLSLVSATGGGELTTTERGLHVVATDASSRRAKIDYVVCDAYAATPSDADVVVLHYVLDAPARFDTMLVRVASRLRPGQRLVIITAISDSTRHPADMRASVVAAGLRVDAAAIEQLPYSLSRHDFAYERTISNTLVLEATKLERPGDPTTDLPVHVYPTHRVADMVASAMAELTPGQRHFPLPDFERVAKPLRQALRGGSSFVDFFARLEGAVGRVTSETIVTYLCAREHLVLTRFPDRYVTRRNLS